MPQIAFGRSVIYYGSGAVNRNVMRFIESQGRWQGRQAPKSRKRAGRQQDPEERRRIETAAVEHAKAYYREQFDDDSCEESVEALCKGSAPGRSEELRVGYEGARTCRARWTTEKY